MAQEDKKIKVLETEIQGIVTETVGLIHFFFFLILHELGTLYFYTSQPTTKTPFEIKQHTPVIVLIYFIINKY